MKYRIKVGNNDMKPFVVQRQNEKSLFKFWHNVENFSRPHEAEALIRRSVEMHSQHGVGKVIFEYDESDLVVDKLKNQNANKTEGGMMAQNVTSAMSMAMTDYVSKEHIMKLAGLKK